MSTVQPRIVEATPPTPATHETAEIPRATASDLRRPLLALSDVILSHALVGARSVLMAALTAAVEERRESGHVFSSRNEQIAREISRLARRIDHAVNDVRPSS